MYSTHPGALSRSGLGRGTGLQFSMRSALTKVCGEVPSPQGHQNFFSQMLPEDYLMGLGVLRKS